MLLLYGWFRFGMILRSKFILLHFDALKSSFYGFPAFVLAINDHYLQGNYISGPYVNYGFYVSLQCTMLYPTIKPVSILVNLAGNSIRDTFIIYYGLPGNCRPGLCHVDTLLPCIIVRAISSLSCFIVAMMRISPVTSLSDVHALFYLYMLGFLS